MRSRDRAVAAAVVLVVVLLAGGVIALVLGAERSGVDTREDLRSEQTRQIAASMETRVQQAYASFGGVYGAPGAFTLEPRSPEDAARLQPQNPSSTTGSILVDDRGVIVNGASLLGKISLPYQAPYVAAKHAVVGLSAALRLELRAERETTVSVCTVLPAGLDTPSSTTPPTTLEGHSGRHRRCTTRIG